jgi:regulator of replication initiation timing
MQPPSASAGSRPSIQYQGWMNSPQSPTSPPTLLSATATATKTQEPQTVESADLLRQASLSSVTSSGDLASPRDLAAIKLDIEAISEVEIPSFIHEMIANHSEPTDSRSLLRKIVIGDIDRGNALQDQSQNIGSKVQAAKEAWPDQGLDMSVVESSSLEEPCEQTLANPFTPRNLDSDEVILVDLEGESSDIQDAAVPEPTLDEAPVIAENESENMPQPKDLVRVAENLDIQGGIERNQGKVALAQSGYSVAMGVVSIVGLGVKQIKEPLAVRILAPISVVGGAVGMVAEGVDLYATARRYGASSDRLDNAELMLSGTHRNKTLKKLVEENVKLKLELANLPNKEDHKKQPKIDKISQIQKKIEFILKLEKKPPSQQALAVAQQIKDSANTKFKLIKMGKNGFGVLSGGYSVSVGTINGLAALKAAGAITASAAMAPAMLPVAIGVGAASVVGTIGLLGYSTYQSKSRGKEVGQLLESFKTNHAQIKEKAELVKFADVSKAEIEILSKSLSDTIEIMKTQILELESEPDSAEQSETLKKEVQILQEKKTKLQLAPAEEISKVKGELTDLITQQNETARKLLTLSPTLAAKVIVEGVKQKDPEMMDLGEQVLGITSDSMNLLLHTGREQDLVDLLSQGMPMQAKL